MPTTTDLQANDHLREQVCAWFRANNINPNMVLRSAPIALSDGAIRYTVWDSGDLADETNMDPDHIPGVYLDEVTGEVIKATRATPTTVEPDAVVRAWLES